ncbi:MAG: TFIIB-type zinc ribbon-containing protein [Thermodesulfovibrionales bacterium]
MNKQDEAIEKQPEALRFTLSGILLAGFGGILRALLVAVIIVFVVYIFTSKSNITSEGQFNAITRILMVGLWGGFIWGVGSYRRAFRPSLFSRVNILSIITVAVIGSLIGLVLGGVIFPILRGFLDLPPFQKQADIFELVLTGLIGSPIMMFIITGTDKDKNETANKAGNNWFHRLGNYDISSIWKDRNKRALDNERSQTRIKDSQAVSYCPQCKSNYREGFTVCSDCGAVLIQHDKG